MTKNDPRACPYSVPCISTWAFERSHYYSPLKFKMANGHHIENRFGRIFIARQQRSMLMRDIDIANLSVCPSVRRSFSYASPRLWNQLPDSFRQPHHSRLDSPPHPLLNSSLTSSPLSSSITPSLFHSRLKTYLFNKSFPP